VREWPCSPRRQEFLSVKGRFAHVIRSVCEEVTLFPTSSGVSVREGPFSPRRHEFFVFF
jgi:hypothetical protein